jgi:hypothetical protein
VASGYKLTIGEGVNDCGAWSSDVRMFGDIRDKIREHRGCISVAQIAPARVDACMRNTNGRRERMNVCLVNDMVPDRKIRILNDASTPASTGNY